MFKESWFLCVNNYRQICKISCCKLQYQLDLSSELLDDISLLKWQGWGNLSQKPWGSWTVGQLVPTYDYYLVTITAFCVHCIFTVWILDNKPGHASEVFDEEFETELADHREKKSSRVSRSKCLTVKMTLMSLQAGSERKKQVSVVS